MSLYENDSVISATTFTYPDVVYSFEPLIQYTIHFLHILRWKNARQSMASILVWTWFWFHQSVVYFTIPIWTALLLYQIFEAKHEIHKDSTLDSSDKLTAELKEIQLELSFLLPSQDQFKQHCRSLFKLNLHQKLVLFVLVYIVWIGSLMAFDFGKIIWLMGLLLLTWNSALFRVIRHAYHRAEYVVRHARSKVAQKPFVCSSFTSMEEHLDRYYRFKVIEHQRWWPCRGWIPLLLGNERPEWSDEYLVQVPSIHKFSLPPPTFKTDKATKKRIKVTWEWASDSWQIDESDKSVDKEGWEYGGWDWKRWSPRSSGLHILTRRRHWIRNARLIEEDEEKETTPISIRRNSCSIPPSVSTSLSSTDSSLCDSSATLSVSPTPSFVQQTKSYSTSTVSLNHHSSRPFSDRLTVDSHFWLCR